MRLFLIFIAFTVFIGSSELFSQGLDDLQDLQDLQSKNRVILLRDTDLESDWLKAQLKRLKSNSAELIEREVTILLVTDTNVYDENKILLALKADAIIEKYALSNFEGLVLIGKDGDNKLKEEFIVSPSRIINLIDSMPMRITELKDKG